MTLYMTTPMYRMRRMMHNWLSDEMPVAETEVTFPVDVKNETEAYVITAFLPGVTADNLDLQIHDDTVTIDGQLKIERSEEDHYLLVERPSGKFHRTLRLPDALDSGNAEADLTNGVLTLRIAKAEEARPKTIKVNSK